MYKIRKLMFCLLLTCGPIHLQIMKDLNNQNSPPYSFSVGGANQNVFERNCMMPLVNDCSKKFKVSQILIVGQENAIRSQMLEGILKKILGHKSRIYSCGFEPSGVDPQAIRAMAEEQVVIAGHTSDALEEFHSFQFDHIFFFPIEKEEHIRSPTFTLINVYRGPIPVNHIDLYRLDSISEIEALGLEEILFSKSVSIIEWSEKLFQKNKPDQPELGIEERIEIRIRIEEANRRTFEIEVIGQSKRSLCHLF